MTSEIEFIEFEDSTEMDRAMNRYEKKIANQKSLKEMRRLGLTVQQSPPMPKRRDPLPGQQELF